MTLRGFERILAAALPNVPEPRLSRAADLVRRYARAEADAGVLEREALAWHATTDPAPAGGHGGQ